MRIPHGVKSTWQSRKKNFVGKRVREARLKARPAISQDDLSGKLAAKGLIIDQTAISRIERQERFLMDYEVRAIAKCLKVTVSWLFGEKK